MSSSYRIGKFAELAGVTARALHHYDRIGLLKPQRGSSGIRLYRLEDHSLVVFLLHNLVSRYLSGRVNVAAGGSRERTHFRRDRELKRRATSRIGARPQAATMRFDNPPADRQSHAGALRFGGEECIEDLVYFFRGKSDA